MHLILVCQILNRNGHTLTLCQCEWGKCRGGKSEDNSKVFRCCFRTLVVILVSDFCEKQTHAKTQNVADKT